MVREQVAQLCICQHWSGARFQSYTHQIIYHISSCQLFNAWIVLFIQTEKSEEPIASYDAGRSIVANFVKDTCNDAQWLGSWKNCAHSVPILYTDEHLRRDLNTRLGLGISSDLSDGSIPEKIPNPSADNLQTSHDNVKHVLIEATIWHLDLKKSGHPRYPQDSIHPLAGRQLKCINNWSHHASTHAIHASTLLKARLLTIATK